MGEEEENIPLLNGEGFTASLFPGLDVNDIDLLFEILKPTLVSCRRRHTKFFRSLSGAQTVLVHQSLRIHLSSWLKFALAIPLPNAIDLIAFTSLLSMS
ncbi:unnamed protein product [Lathyrus oleraceus]